MGGTGRRQEGGLAREERGGGVTLWGGGRDMRNAAADACGRGGAEEVDLAVYVALGALAARVC